MSESPIGSIQGYFMAAISGLLGMVAGVKVGKARIDALHEDVLEIKQDVRELNRKVDRMAERRET